MTDDVFRAGMAGGIVAFIGGIASQMSFRNRIIFIASIMFGIPAAAFILDIIDPL